MHEIAMRAAMTTRFMSLSGDADVALGRGIRNEHRRWRRAAAGLWL